MMKRAGTKRFGHLPGRPLTFDVVLRDAAGEPPPKRSRAVGVAGATSAGPRRMDCHELIDLLTAEEQEMVSRDLRKLLADRRGAGDGARKR